MLDIAGFKEAVDKSLADSSHDMDWLAEQLGIEKAVLAMVLSRKTMKNMTPTLKKVSEITGVEVPKAQEETEEVKPVEDIAKPLITDDDPMLEMNTRELLADGKKYTEQSIRKMVEAGVSEHRELIELDEAFEEACLTIKKLEHDMSELTDKYIKRDKEAIKYQVEAEELREQLAEKKEKNPLLNMTIEEGISQFRALKKLFKDEVLQ